MEIAVIGGTGMLGSEVASQLAAGGHAVRVLSRTPPDELGENTSHQVIDLRSRAGLDEAIDGVDAVVDAGNERRAAKEVLVEGTRDLLERCSRASVPHYVGISIIGCERLGIGYYVAKTEQEEVIRRSSVGWSLFKASQFHELMGSVFEAASRYRISPTGTIPLQTVAASVVAGRMVDAVSAGPSTSVERIAGPAVSDLGTLSGIWRQSNARKCLPVPVLVPGKSGRALREGVLTDQEAATPGPTFEDWLASKR